MAAQGRLNGKVAIVTGSGRGLGLAYAERLAAEGAAVVVNDIDAGTAEAAVKSITAAGGSAVAEVGAVGSTQTAEALVGRAVASFGRLDILVTNAGFLRDTVLWKMTDEDFDSVVNVHLRGTVARGEALPPFARRELGFGAPGDVAGLVAFLASGEAAGVTGQAVGIGGDRLTLWSHPAEAVVRFADGDGWSPDAIAAQWQQAFAPFLQPVGQHFPEAP